MFKIRGMYVNVQLGDALENALKAVGITSERMERWLGRPCNCAERKRRFNLLGTCLKFVALRKTDEAKKCFEELLSENKNG